MVAPLTDEGFPTLEFQWPNDYAHVDIRSRFMLDNLEIRATMIGVVLATMRIRASYRSWISKTDLGSQMMER